MGRITMDLIRKRAEHNEGMIANLEELALHQQHLERIELLHQACRHLRILLLQNNLIHKIQNLHRLKELEYLNLALNNITKLQNLQRCESLKKLDLTMNFVPKAGLLSLHSLANLHHFEELYLMGNPCVDWTGYRQYVVATLPALKRLDGVDIKPSERIAARQALPRLHETLRAELRSEGVDLDEAAAVEDDGLDYDSGAEVEDPGYVDPADGEFKRPWCPATRIIEHRENERTEREQEEKKREGQEGSLFGSRPQKPRWDDFPVITEGAPAYQKNEGEWEFSLEESSDERSIVLDVDIGKFLDTSLVKADVQPGWARLLVKGRLLQLKLPCAVCPDKSVAQRSKITGSLMLTMPKESVDAQLDLGCVRAKHSGRRPAKRPAKNTSAPPPGAVPSPTGAAKASEHARLETRSKNVCVHNIVCGDGTKSGFDIKAVKKADIIECTNDDDHDIPDL